MSVFCGEYTVCAINFLGFSIHPGKQGGQHGNELMLVCVSTSAYGWEGD